jgi:hypothetical protein
LLFFSGKLAHFDSVGIWKYKDIHFSKYGTLKNTLVAIINNSSEGICVLVKTIKYPDFSFEQLSQHLSKQCIKIKPEVILDFFIFYGIEKKTPGSR